MKDIEMQSKAEQSLLQLEKANEALKAEQDKLADKEAELDKISEKEEAETVSEDKQEVAEEAAEAAPEYTETEKEAMEKGWKPNGGPKSAEEFLRSEPLYKEISESHKQIKELKQIVETLNGQMTEQKELGYKQALEDLENQRVEAIQLGDVEAVNKIEEAMNTYKKPEEPSHHESVEAKEFFNRHASWLNDPSYEAQKIREFAEKRDKDLLQYNLSPVEHIKTIEQDIKGEFGESRFFATEKEEIARSQAVEAPTASAPVNKSLRPVDLEEAEKQVYYYLKNSDKSGKSAKSYLKQIQQMRGE